MIRHAESSMPELLAGCARRAPDEPALFARRPEGAWDGLTWGAADQAVSSGAAQLRRHGVCPGDRVAIMARTRREWLLAEYAVMRAGGRVVGVESHAPAQHVAHVLEHARPVALIVDGASCLEKIPPTILDALRVLVTLDEPVSPRASLPSLSAPDFFQAAPTESPPVEGNGIGTGGATLIYTSGTSGAPKAIEYDHAQLLAACQAIVHVFPEVGDHDSTVCWLPMAHLFQRMLNLVAIERGAPIYFIDDPRSLVSYLPEIRPSVLIGVPRFFEKLSDEFDRRLRRIPRAFRWLFRIPAGQILRRALGGRMRFMLTGSAPCPAHVLDFFRQAGIPLLEAYGISENTIPMAVNRPGAWRPGSVGRPLPENEIRLAGDGEVLVRGPGVFHGYYRDNSPSNRFTPDGFYMTGDYGILDDDGFLFLKGRKSDLIKTSTGRRVSPAHIESLLQGAPCFEHAVVIGHGRKHLAAILTLNRAWLAQELGIPPSTLTPDHWQQAAPAHRKMLTHIESINRHLPEHERIHSFTVLTRGLAIETGELTPTLKVRRRAVETRYRDLVEEIYTPHSA